MLHGQLASRTRELNASQARHSQTQAELRGTEDRLAGLVHEGQADAAARVQVRYSICIKYRQHTAYVFNTANQQKPPLKFQFCRENAGEGRGDWRRSSGLKQRGAFRGLGELIGDTIGQRRGRRKGKREAGRKLEQQTRNCDGRLACSLPVEVGCKTSKSGLALLHKVQKEFSANTSVPEGCSSMGKGAMRIKSGQLQYHSLHNV